MAFVTLLDELLEFFRRSSLGLHLCGIKEDSHLCLAAGLIERNRVENVVSISHQWAAAVPTNKDDGKADS